MQKGAKASGWVFVCLVKSCSLSTFRADTLTEVSNVLSITVSATLWVESCGFSCTTKAVFCGFGLILRTVVCRFYCRML